jgi:hypothetical protein
VDQECSIQNNVYSENSHIAQVKKIYVFLIIGGSQVFPMGHGTQMYFSTPAHRKITYPSSRKNW